MEPDPTGMLERPGKRRRRHVFRLLVALSSVALVWWALWQYRQVERLVTGERADVLDVRQCSTHNYKGTRLYTCRATWRFSDERTGEGDVDAGTEPTRKGSTVFAGDDWGYRSRGDLMGSVLPKAGVFLLVLGELAVLLVISRWGRRRGYTLPRGR
ncbi:hypothetical protein ACFV2X_00665 [Streptomyces sp. NPDC059679]|uniref:hypothetical protein n=1 Tax=Streptomyces sp. NPDC059679 TaxID=3346903 RepID=UPI0036C0FF6A